MRRRATYTLRSYRPSYGLGLLAIIALLAMSACSSAPPPDLPIPPAQSMGSTVNVTPTLLSGGSANSDMRPEPSTVPSAPPAYFGPNGIGTGTTSGPSPYIPFVDSVSSCAAILDGDARQLCLQRAGSR